MLTDWDVNYEGAHHILGINVGVLGDVEILWEIEMVLALTF